MVTPNEDAHSRTFRELRAEIAQLREALRTSQAATAAALAKALANRAGADAVERARAEASAAGRSATLNVAAREREVAADIAAAEAAAARLKAEVLDSVILVKRMFEVRYL